VKLILRAGGVLRSGPEKILVDDYMTRAQGLARGTGFLSVEEQGVELKGQYRAYAMTASPQVTSSLAARMGLNRRSLKKCAPDVSPNGVSAHKLGRIKWCALWPPNRFTAHSLSLHEHPITEIKSKILTARLNRVINGR